VVRRLLTLIAVIALMGAGACGGDDDEDAGGGTPKSAGTAEQDPAAAEEALKDTSARPEIPKPTGTPPRRLVKQDIVKGKGPPAQLGDTLVVHYVGMNFSNGQEFDASWDRGEPFPFQLGAPGLIEGWQKGLVGIRKGGRRMLTIPPELAYGPEGRPPTIPPNETLIFVIDAVNLG
jgi:peptidylprolyl isomerase